ncbi:MAG: hypothetical protein L3J87_05555 [Thermoplasmata archaeon]|nr:hypothetical protein [Thermoplasmata archaeon]MCI4345071.1 hypothetical protein [Thermoplasmata archaeon]
MAGSLPAPKTEADLLVQLPPTNQPGALPRELLPPGEHVLFETRPGFFALYWGRLIVILLFLALFFGVAATSVSALPGGVILGTPFLLWLIVLVVQWRHQVYALTDQRVIRVSGVRGSQFQDASYVQVHNLATEPGISGGLRFDTTPPSAYGGGAHAGRQRPLRWDGIAKAPLVYAFVQEAFAFGLRRQTEALAAQAALDKFTAASIRCEYCGGPIELASLDPLNPKCPTCSAPVRLPS